MNDEPHGKDWECWTVEDHGIEYHLDIENRQTSLVAISAPPWWDMGKLLTDLIHGTHRAVFTLNSPRLVKLIDKANEYFDAHDEELDPKTEQRIRLIVLRELRKRGIR